MSYNIIKQTTTLKVFNLTCVFQLIKLINIVILVSCIVKFPVIKPGTMSEHRSTRNVIYAHVEHLKDKVRSHGEKKTEEEEDLSQEKTQEDIVDEKSTEVEEEVDEGRSTRTVIYAHLKHFKDKVRNLGEKKTDKEEEPSQEDMIVDEESTQTEEEVEEEEAELTEEEINAAVSELRQLGGRLAGWLEVRENTILQLRQTADYIDGVGRRTNIAKAEYSTAPLHHCRAEKNKVEKFIIFSSEKV